MGNFKTLVVLGLLSLGLLSACGKKSGDQTSEIDNAPVCRSEFNDDYNQVASAVNMVRADLDRAYGPSKPLDKLDLAIAQRKAYRSSQDCRRKAIVFKNKYDGVKCAAKMEGKAKLIDVNARMNEVIKGMDMVPAA